MCGFIGEQSFWNCVELRWLAHQRPAFPEHCPGRAVIGLKPLMSSHGAGYPELDHIEKPPDLASGMVHGRRPLAGKNRA